MTLGTPGGSTIITSVVQTIFNVHEFNMTMQEAVNSPRFHHQWKPDSIRIESELFNDKKINKIERSSYPVIFSNNSIVWIPGLAHSNNNYFNYNNLLAITCERKD